MNMSFVKGLSSVFTLLLLVSLSTATYNLASRSNVAVYWVSVDIAVI